MGWILFLNEEEKPCAWPDESTMIGINEEDEVMMTCGKTKSLPAESPTHTNDWEQVLMWVENGPPLTMDEGVIEPGLGHEPHG